MSNSVINLTSQVSLQEAEDAICAFGNTNAVHLVGEPGVGKTAMHAKICERLGMRGVYIDVPNVELGELGIPMPNHETKTTTLYPNEAWGFHTGEPLVFFLDEFPKGAQAVQNTLHPLLNERRIANFKLHENSVVITAGNNMTDGVGDLMKSHTLNRVTVMAVRKPTSDEWREWGAQNDVAPEVLAWAKQYAQAFGSYLDPSQADNPYIFNPKHPQKAFVSPRSLHRASNIIKKRDLITKNALEVALAGTIGNSAAKDMVAYVDVADSLPTWESIITNPEQASVPSSPAALCILAYSALQRIDRTNIGKWFEYMKRTSTELQSVFCLTAVKSREKKDMVMSSKVFVDWMREHQYLF
jgi:hypothetical protein